MQFDNFILGRKDKEAFEFTFMSKYYKYFYYTKYKMFHRLDGPALQKIGYGGPNYYIDGEFFSEEDYWKHPDVLAFKFLKTHPELEAFV